MKFVGMSMMRSSSRIVLLSIVLVVMFVCLFGQMIGILSVGVSVLSRCLCWVMRIRCARCGFVLVTLSLFWCSYLLV